MKRPNRFDYPHGSYGDISFLKQLNKYCSYLESKNKSIQLMQADVVGQSEQLCYCGNKADEKYSPCCTLEHWHNKFSY